MKQKKCQKEAPSVRRFLCHLFANSFSIVASGHIHTKKSLPNTKHLQPSLSDLHCFFFSFPLMCLNLKSRGASTTGIPSNRQTILSFFFLKELPKFCN
ncbi:hypothetical protein B9Z55_010545 [Caenorhabditis nigoni]|uniref:Uncharacterized protein n=1 Tax=Caenorhabditis nigoni TaxID=1611254 RepID=A0A2G5UGJ2_9PELO|nr:hypothetical protein B9Z55_010545 [Caenorhabditis nigoni]